MDEPGCARGVGVSRIVAFSILLGLNRHLRKEQCRNATAFRRQWHRRSTNTANCARHCFEIRYPLQHMFVYNCPI